MFVRTPAGGGQNSSGPSVALEVSDMDPEVASEIEWSGGDDPDETAGQHSESQRVAESGAGVAGGEVPVDLPLVGVDVVLPCGQLGVEQVYVVDAPVETLAGQRG